MDMLRSARTVVLAAAIASCLLTAACGASAPTPRASAPARRSATQDPVTTLRQAAKALDSTTYHFEVADETPPGSTKPMDMEFMTSGAIDPVARSGRVTRTWTRSTTARTVMQQDVIMIGKDRWATAEIGAPTGLWLHFAADRMPSTGIDK